MKEEGLESGEKYYFLVFYCFLFFLGKVEKISEKLGKSGLRCISVAEHMPSTCKVLGAMPTPKTKTKTQTKTEQNNSVNGGNH